MTETCPGCKASYSELGSKLNDRVQFKCESYMIDNPPELCESWSCLARQLTAMTTERDQLKAELNPPFSHCGGCKEPALAVTCLSCEQSSFEDWYAENTALMADRDQWKAKAEKADAAVEWLDRLESQAIRIHTHFNGKEAPIPYYVVERELPNEDGYYEGDGPVQALRQDGTWDSDDYIAYFDSRPEAIEAAKRSET